MEQTGLARPIAPAALATALWAWLVVGAVFAVGLWSTGASALVGAAALAMAAAPAFGMFLWQPLWTAPNAGAGAMIIWTGFAVAACIVTGGAASPLTPAFLIGPVLALRLSGGRHALDSVILSAVGLVVAHWGALPAEPGAQAVLPIAAMLIVVFAAWCMAAPSVRAEPLDLAPLSQKAPPSQVALHAASMAHELRTPLTHILGFAEMIQSQVFGPLQAKYVEYAGLIRQSGGQLLAQVNELMDFARIEAGKWPLEREPFDVVAVCAEVVAQAEGQAGPKAIAVSYEGPDALIVNADPRAVRHMMINLVGNAVKFTPNDGAVVVGVAVEAEVLVLSVRDTGPGFPLSAFTRLGQAYERADNAEDVPGTGLGLALVRALAGLHGGALVIANGDEGGAIVTVRLPGAVPLA